MFLIFIVSSCTDDVKFNNPAFQTLKNNVFWRAVDYKASTATNGIVVIEGALGYEKVILRVSYVAERTYALGIDDVTTASYLNTFPGELAQFNTGTNKGNGQIVITHTDGNTISGTFKFTAINKNGSDIENPKITFTEGVFYKIPITQTVEF